MGLILVDTSILIDNLPFTVIGVAPPEFFGVDPAVVPDVYLPIHANELLGAAAQFGFRPETYFDRNYYWIQVMARLRPGVTPAQAAKVGARSALPTSWVIRRPAGTSGPRTNSGMLSKSS